MIEPNLEYYKVDLGDIWSYQKDLYDLGHSNLSDTLNLKERYEELILYTKRWQYEDKDKFKITITPFVTVTDYDNNTKKAYFLRHLNEYKSFKRSEDFLKIDYFMNKNEFYSHIQTIYIHPSSRDFEFWFALKLSQYNLGLKFVNEFLTFNLKHLFESNIDVFKTTIEIVIAQFSEKYFTKNLTKFVSQWINQFETNSLEIGNMQIKDWHHNTFTNDDLFFISSEIDLPLKSDNTKTNEPSSLEKKKVTNSNTPEVHLKHLTFYDSKFAKFRFIGDTDFSFKMEEILKEFVVNNLISGKTKTAKFLDLFTKSNLQKSNRIHWIGNAYLLREFIILIAKSSIGQKLEGTDKWAIAQKCFIAKFKDMEDVGEITNYKSLQKAAKSNDKDIEKLKSIVSKLIQLHTNLELE